MKKEKYLINEAKKMSGNILGIGDFSNDIIKEFENNKNIIDCSILSNNSYSIGEGDSKSKKVRISKLRSFKKKKISYLICDYDKIDKYLKTFIKDSIYITKNYIYFVTKDNELIKKLYNRYDVQIEEIKCGEEYIVIIDTSKAKNNVLKEFIYRIIDFIQYVIKIIDNLLFS